MEKVQFLESILGNGTKANRDYYQFHCPFCLHHKKKLGVAMNSGRWRCWVCPAKGLSVQVLLWKLKVELSRIEYSKELWPIRHENVQIDLHPVTLELPTQYKPLWKNSISFFYKKAKGYLYERGVGRLDILKHQIGYCESGSYNEMVIFPSFTENFKLNHYFGRTFMNAFKRFKEPDNISKDLIQDENLINWLEPVVLVESRIDAITVKRNAVPLGGKFIPKSLKVKILENGTPEIIFCLDGDALKEAKNNAEYFIKHGVKVRIAELPEDQDPNSLGFEKVWEFIDNAQPFTESDIFKFKILNKLNG